MPQLQLALDDTLNPPPVTPGQTITVCAWCGRYLEKTGRTTPDGMPEQRIGAVVPNHKTRPDVSHGMCYNCYQDMMAEPLKAAEWTFRRWLKVQEAIHAGPSTSTAKRRPPDGRNSDY
jgi:hypothetical protein